MRSFLKEIIKVKEKLTFCYLLNGRILKHGGWNHRLEPTTFSEVRLEAIQLSRNQESKLE
jgi:hypothetical protein